MTDLIFILPIATFCAMFDSDGCIYVTYEKKYRKNGTFYVNLTWKYSFSQSEGNDLNVAAVAQMLDIKTRDKKRLSGRDAGAIEVCCGGTMLSPSGQTILSAYRESPPKSLFRLKQFLACEYCTTTLASTEDKQNLIRELLIAEAVSSDRKQPVEPIIQELQEQGRYSATVVAEGRKLAAEDLQMLEKKWMEIWKKVPETPFTAEEVRGLAVSDGSIGIVFKFEDRAKNGNKKLYFVPYFSVTNMDREPCDALKKTFGTGSVTRSGNSAFQYRATGTTFFKNQLRPIFENADLYSSYKQQQWDKTWDIVQRLEKGEHKTFDGFCKIIDDCYGISNVNKRTHPIEYYKNPQFLSGIKRRSF